MQGPWTDAIYYYLENTSFLYQKSYVFIFCLFKYLFLNYKVNVNTGYIKNNHFHALYLVY
jgi:hypothetical protein